MLKKGFCVVISMMALVSVSGSYVHVFAKSASLSSAVSESVHEKINYDSYRLKHANMNFGKDPITLFAENAIKTSGTIAPLMRPDKNLKDITYTAVLLDKEGASVTWRFDVPADGIYHMYVICTPIGDRQDLLDFSVKLNDKHPFDEAGSVIINRTYKDSTAITQDKYGNDLRPRPTEVRLWQAHIAQEYDGRYNEPYIFMLKSGTNTLEVISNQGNIAIAAVSLQPDSTKMTYAEYIEKYNKNPPA